MVPFGKNHSKLPRNEKIAGGGRRADAGYCYATSWPLGVLSARKILHGLISLEDGTEMVFYIHHETVLRAAQGKDAMR